MTIICPLCSDSVEDIKTHLMRHFKYKKFPCAHLDCDERFYTENERKLHCDKTKHRRCFQETVNVYLDMIVEMVSKDATLLESIDFSTIVESRRAAIADSSANLEKMATKQPINTPNLVRRKRTTTENKEAEKEGASSTKSKRRSKTLTATHSEDDTTVTTTSAPAENVLRTPARSRKSDVEKKQNNDTPPPQTTIPIALEQTLAMNTSDDGSTTGDALMGFYDPNDPLRRDWSKVTCNICNNEVMYDYISRKFHVTKEHIKADNDPEDYEVLYKSKMEEAFPDLPNSDNACQLCMTGSDVRVGARREHIERKHFMALVELSCPVDKCGTKYFRQCDLGAHMRTSHKIDLSKYKDREFQDGRKRRNAMISMMTNKCFPIAQFSTFIKHTKPVEKADPSQALNRAKELSDAANCSAFSTSFVNDVRVRELEKTRRAPIYNQDSSSSSDSSDDEKDEDVNKKDKRKLSLSEEEQRLSEDDVIFLSQTFESQMMQKLKQIATVKSEASKYPEDLIVQEQEQQPVVENVIVEEKNEEQICIIQPPGSEENDKTSPDATVLLTNVQKEEEKEEVKEPIESIEKEKEKEEIESRDNRKERDDMNITREPQRFRQPSNYSERREFSNYRSTRDRYTPYSSRDSYLPYSSSSSSRDRGSSSYYSSNPPPPPLFSHYNRSQSVPRSDRNYRSKHYPSYSSNRDY